jgi:hypothetical protein
VDQHFGEHNSAEMWRVCRQLFQVTMTHAHTHTHARTHTHTHTHTTATTKDISQNMSQLCSVLAGCNSTILLCPNSTTPTVRGAHPTVQGGCHRPLHSSSSHSICLDRFFSWNCHFPPSLSVHQCSDLSQTLSNTSS